MPKFSYTATNAAGKVVTGTIEAEAKSTALETLHQQNLRPIAMKLANGTKKGGILSINIGKGKVKPKDLVVFTRQLSTMISAGVPLLRAINTLQSQSENPALERILNAVARDVSGGMSLADALHHHPATFSDVYVNMVRAGEAAGILDDILKRLALQQEKNASIRKKIKSAMSYPVVLMVITIGSFFGLMIFVIPQIGKIIKSLGGEGATLPPITEFMLAISGFMVQRWYIVLAGMILLVYFGRRWVKTPKGKQVFQAFMLRIPIIGPVIRKIAVARFARTFASLMGAGVSVLESLHITGRAIGNIVYQNELDRAIEEVKGGKQLSQALSTSKLFPAIIPQMLAVGEETGQTDTVLIKVADFFEEEADATIDSLSSVIEPVMIAIMGTMVGLIAYSVMGPISNLSNQIKG